MMQNKSKVLSNRDKPREHFTFGMLKREEFRCEKWQNEQRIPEQQFLEDLVVHQILVVYSDGYERKAKDMCLKLRPLLSKVALSLHSAAMFQCACKRCPTILCMCFTPGRSSLQNHIFFKNPRLSCSILFPASASLLLFLQSPSSETENLFYATLGTSEAPTDLFSIEFSILLCFNYVSIVVRFYSLRNETVNLYL